MNNLKMINKEILKSEAQQKILKGFIPKSSQMIHIVEPGVDLKKDQGEKFKMAMTAKPLTRNLVMSERILKYGSVYDIPQPCMTLNGEKMSLREMHRKGVFASSNSLPADWQTLWDALRIDISIRKAAQGTSREFFYNIINMPASDKVFKATEFYPYGVVFEENNGEGQSVTQGETRGGQVEPIEHIIYAAGFTWTLLAELFDSSFDTERLNDSVLVGYNAKRDDLSLAPIINFVYSGAQVTSANATSGAGRQELLYLTLEDAIDGLADREDPVTKREIIASDLRILAHPEDARHIARVAAGLPSTNERVYPSLSEISSVVGYDGETIDMREKTISYSGVPQGTAFLVKVNRYMNVGIKRALTLESDMTPDVTTLSREQRSWYFVEGQQTTGISDFVQKIELPAW